MSITNSWSLLRLMSIESVIPPNHLILCHWGGESSCPSTPLLTPLHFLQRCFQTTNGYLSNSRSCSSNYSVAALATSSLVGELWLPPPALGICTASPSHWRWEGQGRIAAGGTAALLDARVF